MIGNTIRPRIAGALRSTARRRAAVTKPAGPGEGLALSQLDRDLLADVDDHWVHLDPSVIERGRGVADALRRQCPDAPDAELATGLLRTAHTLGAIAGTAEDPDGFYWALVTELGIACRDLTEFDRAGVQP